jgi:hypothetical protein
MCFDVKSGYVQSFNFAPRLGWVSSVRVCNSIALKRGQEQPETLELAFNWVVLTFKRRGSVELMHGEPRYHPARSASSRNQRELCNLK